MKSPLVVVCAVFITGIAAAGMAPPLSETILLAITALVIALLYMALHRNMHRTVLALMVAGWLVAGFLALQDVNFSSVFDDRGSKVLSSRVTGTTQILEGYIDDNPRTTGANVRFTLRASVIVENNERYPVQGKIAVTVRNSEALLKRGDYVRLTSSLKKPRNFHNPGGFDYAGFLARRGIQYTASINHPAHIIVLRRGDSRPSLEFIEARRAEVRDRIEMATPSPQRELLGALILGERERIPPHIREGFIRTGVAHILAISGFHIGLAAFFTFLAVRLIMSSWTLLLLKANLFKVSALLALPATLYYALLAGFGISTQRATLMIALFALSLLVSRSGNLINTLSLAAIVILAVAPDSLFHISFQLSFTAVAAIALTLPRVHPLLERFELRGVTKNIIIFFVVTAAAAAATSPLVAYYFNRISTVVLLSNALVVPVAGFCALPLGIAGAFLASVLPGLSQLLFTVSGWFLTPALSIIGRLEELPGSSLGLAPPSAIGMICFYGGFFLLLKLIDFLHQKVEGTVAPGRIALASAGLALVTIIGIGHGQYLERTAIPANRLELTCLDVGQGSAAVVTFPDRSVMVVDGGGFFDPAFDTGKNIVAPYLRHRRIRTIDYLVLTHPHQDHLGGLPYLLETFRVHEVWSNGDPSDTASFHRFLDLIEHRAIPHHVLWSESPDRHVGGAVVSFVSPLSPCRRHRIADPHYDLNRYSLVFTITWGDRSFLLTGDLTGNKEEDLLALDIPLRSDVLQVPHHGSHLSSYPEFLEAVSPRLAVASLGYENRFAFPRPEVIERYRDAGVLLYRTDLHGAITIGTDGTELYLSCVLPCDSFPPEKSPDPAH